jgi:hypothetical protein
LRELRGAVEGGGRSEAGGGRWKGRVGGERGRVEVEVEVEVEGGVGGRRWEVGGSGEKGKKNSPELV